MNIFILTTLPFPLNQLLIELHKSKISFKKKDLLSLRDKVSELLDECSNEG